MSVLKIEPSTTRQWTTILGPFGGWFAGGLIGPAFFGIGTMTGGVLFGVLVLLAASKSKAEAHTMKHFQDTLHPNLAYQIYTSHLADGSLNEDVKMGYKKVRMELNRSTYIVDLGSRFISAYGPASKLRLWSENEHHTQLFLNELGIAEENNKKDSTLHLVHECILTELKNSKQGAEERALTAITQKQLYNYQGKEDKTILHFSIENDKFSFAKRLLELNQIDCNLQDRYGNTPILLLMNKLNSVYFQTNEAYELGIKLLEKNPGLELENKSGQTIAKIYATWHWHGVNGRAFAAALKNKISNSDKNVLDSRKHLMK